MNTTYFWKYLLDHPETLGDHIVIYRRGKDDAFGNYNLYRNDLYRPGEGHDLIRRLSQPDKDYLFMFPIDSNIDPRNIKRVLTIDPKELKIA